jgi:hypothetical protein
LPLIKNNEYVLKVKINNTEKEYNFTTILSPFYTSVESIKYSIIGDIISEIEDKDIMLNIFDNSVLADEIASSSDNSFDLENPPYYVQKYVLEKTKYDLLFRVYLNLINKASHNNQLADFRTEARRPDLKDLLDMLKKAYLEWEEQIRGLTNRGRAKPTSATRAGSTSYPLGERRF